MMPPLAITLIFPRPTFKHLLSKSSFHLKNLFLSPLIVSLIRTKSSSYRNSLSALYLAILVTSTTTAHTKCDSTGSWCITLNTLMKIRTTVLRAHSTGIPNPSRTLTYLSHQLNSYTPLAAINSNNTSI